jgi:hypothetical protein
MSEFRSDAYANASTQQTIKQIQAVLQQPALPPERRAELESELDRIVRGRLDSVGTKGVSGLMTLLDIPMRLVGRPIIGTATAVSQMVRDVVDPNYDGGDWRKWNIGRWFDIIRGDHEKLAEEIPSIAGEHGIIGGSPFLENMGWSTDLGEKKVGGITLPGGNVFNRLARFAVSLGLDVVTDPLAYVTAAGAGRGPLARLAQGSNVNERAVEIGEIVLRRHNAVSRGVLPKMSPELSEDLSRKAARAVEDAKILPELVEGVKPRHNTLDDLLDFMDDPYIQQDVIPVLRDTHEIAYRSAMDDVLRTPEGRRVLAEVGDDVAQAEKILLNVGIEEAIWADARRAALKNLSADTVEASVRRAHQLGSATQERFMEFGTGNTVVTSRGKTVPLMDMSMGGGIRFGSMSGRGGVTIPGTVGKGREFNELISQPVWAAIKKAPGLGRLANSVEEFIKKYAPRMNASTGQVMLAAREGRLWELRTLQESLRVDMQGAAQRLGILESSWNDARTAARGAGEDELQLNENLFEWYERTARGSKQATPEVDALLGVDPAVREATREHASIVARIDDQLWSSLREFVPDLPVLANHAPRVPTAAGREKVRRLGRSQVDVGALRAEDPEDVGLWLLDSVLNSSRAKTRHGVIAEPGGHARSKSLAAAVTEGPAPSVQLTTASGTVDLFDMEAIGRRLGERGHVTTKRLNELLEGAFERVANTPEGRRAGLDRLARRADGEFFEKNITHAYESYLQSVSEAIAIHRAVATAERMSVMSKRAVGDGYEVSVQDMLTSIFTEFGGLQVRFAHVLGALGDERWQQVRMVRVAGKDVEVPAIVAEHPRFQELADELNAAHKARQAGVRDAASQRRVTVNELVKGEGYRREFAQMLADGQMAVPLDELWVLMEQMAGEISESFDDFVFQAQRKLGVSAEDFDAERLGLLLRSHQQAVREARRKFERDWVREVAEEAAAPKGATIRYLDDDELRKLGATLEVVMQRNHTQVRQSLVDRLSALRRRIDEENLPMMDPERGPTDWLLKVNDLEAQLHIIDSMKAGDRWAAYTAVDRATRDFGTKYARDAAFEIMELIRVGSFPKHVPVMRIVRADDVVDLTDDQLFALAQSAGVTPPSGKRSDVLAAMFGDGDELAWNETLTAAQARDELEMYFSQVDGFDSHFFEHPLVEDMAVRAIQQGAAPELLPTEALWGDFGRMLAKQQGIADDLATMGAEDAAKIVMERRAGRARGRPVTYMEPAEAQAAYDKIIAQHVEWADARARRLNHLFYDSAFSEEPHSRLIHSLTTGQDMESAIGRSRLAHITKNPRTGKPRPEIERMLMEAEADLWRVYSDRLGLTAQGKALRVVHDPITESWRVGVWSEATDLAAAPIAKSVGGDLQAARRGLDNMRQAVNITRGINPKNSGATFNPLTGRVRHFGEKVYVVSVERGSMIVPWEEWERTSEQVLMRATLAHREELLSDPEAYLGYWLRTTEDGVPIEVHVDLSFATDDWDRAWQRGLDEDQIAIFDMGTGEFGTEHYIPSSRGKVAMAEAREAGEDQVFHQAKPTAPPREHVALPVPAKDEMVDRLSTLDWEGLFDNPELLEMVDLINSGANLAADIKPALGLEEWGLALQEALTGPATSRGAAYNAIYEVRPGRPPLMTKLGRELKASQPPENWHRVEVTAQYIKALGDLGPDAPRAVRQRVRESYDFQMRAAELFSESHALESLSRARSELAALADTEMADMASALGGLVDEVEGFLRRYGVTADELGNPVYARRDVTTSLSPGFETFADEAEAIRGKIGALKGETYLEPRVTRAGNVKSREVPIAKGKVFEKIDEAFDPMNSLQSSSPVGAAVLAEHIGLQTGPFEGKFFRSNAIATFFENWIDTSQNMWTPSGISGFVQRHEAFIRLWRGLNTVSKPFTFNSRNLLGGLWNNQIISVGLDDYRFALSAIPFMKEYRKKGLRGALDALPDRKSRAVFQAAYDNGALDSFSITDLHYLLERSVGTRGGARAFLSAVNPLNPKDFLPSRLGGRLMSDIETFMRIAAFHRHFDAARPASAKVAATLSNAVHFDYSDLTNLERKIKTFVPFWVWSSRNLQLQARVLVERPELIARYWKLQRAVEQNFGDDREGQGYFGPPSWWGPGAVPTNYVLNGSEAPFWAEVWFDPDIPIMDLLNVPLFAGEGIGPKAWANWAASMLGPQLDMLSSITSEEEGFQGTAPGGLAWAIRAANLIPGVNLPVRADGRVPADPNAVALFDTMFPWWRDLVEPLTVPEDRARAQRLGYTPDDTGVPARLRAWFMQQAKGVGISLRTPQEGPGWAYETSERLAEATRRDLDYEDLFFDPDQLKEYERQSREAQIEQMVGQYLP